MAIKPIIHPEDLTNAFYLEAHPPKTESDPNTLYIDNVGLCFSESTVIKDVRMHSLNPEQTVYFKLPKDLTKQIKALKDTRVQINKLTEQHKVQAEKLQEMLKPYFWALRIFRSNGLTDEI